MIHLFQRYPDPEVFGRAIALCGASGLPMPEWSQCVELLTCEVCLSEVIRLAQQRREVLRGEGDE